MALKVTESMSMGSLGFNQRLRQEGCPPLTLPLILSPSIWVLVNKHQWEGPWDRSLALRKINIRRSHEGCKSFSTEQEISP